MKIRTQCTLVICGLFIIEILPVPFSALYSLYAIRKRPDWIPKLVDKLYADKPVNEAEVFTYASLPGHDPMQTRKKYTIILIAMFIVDLLIPTVIPSALYIVRARPTGFKKLIAKLYADKLPTVAQHTEFVYTKEVLDPKTQAELDKKLADLERNNRAFAKSLVIKAYNI